MKTRALCRLCNRARLGFEHLLNTFISSAFAGRLSAYIRSRKLTALVFVISAVLMVAFMPMIWETYAYSPPPATDITIVTSDEGSYIIKEAGFRFIYSRGGKDKVTLSLVIESTGDSLEGEWLMLILSENLRPTGLDSDPFEVGYKELKPFRFRTDYFRGYKHVYEFADRGAVWIIEEFTGDLFGENEVELRLDLYIFSYDERIVPVTVTIQGLDETNLYSVYPQPAQRERNFLIYEFNSFVGDSLRSGINIDLAATDPKVVQSIQFKLFFFGAGLAILTSAMVNILTDFASYVPEEITPRALQVLSESSTQLTEAAVSLNESIENLRLIQPRSQDAQQLSQAHLKQEYTAMTPDVIRSLIESHFEDIRSVPRKNPYGWAFYHKKVQRGRYSTRIARATQSGTQHTTLKLAVTSRLDKQDTEVTIEGEEQQVLELFRRELDRFLEEELPTRPTGSLQRVLRSPVE